MDFLLKNSIKISKSEERRNDAWFDISLRQLREGEVRFYHARDFLTGNWLFKVCVDKELGKVTVKAVKCPPGRVFVQLEGNSMVFQKSKVDGMFYDVVSLTYLDDDNNLHRKIVTNKEEIPRYIQENFLIKTYKEAVGKKAAGKHWVTLCNWKDEKAMITLFLLERAWTLSKFSPEEKLKEVMNTVQKKREKKWRKIPTGQLWKCPICGDEYAIIHFERENAYRHRLEKKRKL